MTKVTLSDPYYLSLASGCLDKAKPDHILLPPFMKVLHCQLAKWATPSPQGSAPFCLRSHSVPPCWLSCSFSNTPYMFCLHSLDAPPTDCHRVGPYLRHTSAARLPMGPQYTSNVSHSPPCCISWYVLNHLPPASLQLGSDS